MDCGQEDGVVSAGKVRVRVKVRVKIRVRVRVRVKVRVGLRSRRQCGVCRQG